MISDKDFLEELHKEELMAFKALLKVIEKYKLRYYAIGGTLIGAVRHKGFIPWDDDIDIGMPREDYELLKSVIRDELEPPYVAEDFSWLTDEKNIQCYFLRVRSDGYKILEKLDNIEDERLGFFIDIIPMDGTPNFSLFRKFYYLKVLYLRFKGGVSHAGDGIRTRRPGWEKMILSVARVTKLYKIVRTSRVYRAMDKLFKRYPCYKADFCGTITGIYKTREIVPTEWFGLDREPVVLPFEDIEIRVPFLYHEYLCHMFGDYMKPPTNIENSFHYRKA